MLFRSTGLPNRYGWAVAPRQPEVADRRGGAGLGDPTCIVKYDLQTGARTVHDFGPSAQTGEPVFVPARDGAGEDEGYLVTYVFDADRSTSSFVVLDAADMGVDPIATVELPQRVPNGFHGSWFAAG